MKRPPMSLHRAVGMLQWAAAEIPETDLADAMGRVVGALRACLITGIVLGATSLAVGAWLLSLLHQVMPQ